MNIDTYRKCTNWNTGYRIDVLTPVFSIYRKPVWYSSRDVPNNNLEDVCQWLIKFTINSPFASSSSCLLSLSACHTWSHTCLDRARWSARRGRLLIHLPQAIPIPASAFNMNDCLLVTSSHGIRFKNPLQEKRADVQTLRPRQAFRGRNPPEQGRLHRTSPQAAEAVVTPHPPPALFRANYYIQRDIIFVVSWHWNKHWQ